MTDALPPAALPPTVRVYVNERPVDVPRAAPVRDAVVAYDAEQGARLAAGAVQVTDSRGLPLDASTPAHGGAIYRLIPVRARAADPDPSA